MSKNLNQEKEKKPAKDHRELGTLLDLFSFHEIAPGAPFWHPKGMIIFKELERYLREELARSGYDEISTPIMVKKELFEQSGHWQHYRENMFWFKNPTDEQEVLALKPMNCPESTFIYSAKTRSYKDLPLRFSEIGRLHRNERSGTLGGLFRARQITMDDAHIYCRPDQIQNEIKMIIHLIKKFYALFGFETKYFLSTKPDKALGDKKVWQGAEEALGAALKSERIKFKEKPKDGAFYGPKIDVQIKDSLGREWQLATIQLDLVMLPQQFDVFYIDEEGKKQRPLVIHRAILGSFERFIGILTEHLEGAFPLWLAPVQVRIVAVSDKSQKYAEKLKLVLVEHGVRTELASATETLGKRIRQSELDKIPYTAVVGEKEMNAKTVNIRNNRSNSQEETDLELLVQNLTREIGEKT